MQQIITPHSLSPEEKENIRKIITGDLSVREEIIAGLLFGSFTEGQFRDIDIGLVLESSYIPERYYEQHLELQISRSVHFHVDIRVLNSAPVRFVYNVIKKQQILFCRDMNAFSLFESGILSRYFDYEYYLKRYRREMFGIL